ncbi:MAG: tRNA uridine-5-carboxymethylaminomethyl(34) synthesis GTPase MnmE [Rhodobacteraceae bacterium]|nr:tRNA uridine-5-carboxymethylaminomethyl(34) synthesis GTPase MnmE [Paracoccaceae bacterium]
MEHQDTIYALASARGRAGVAIIRVSGPHAFDACIALSGSVPTLRQARLSVLRHQGVELDQALVLAFGKGASFTGEEVIEFHLHGGIAVVNSVLQALSEIDGLRMAEAGEFTRRALENDCLDLAQVEGLSDLIEAETEAQRKQAFLVLSGVLGDKTDHWRKDLLRATALLEATIDFVDEDVPVDVFPEVKALISQTKTSIADEISGSFIAERIRDGFEVAIVGPPNIGKSTLLNTISGRDAAITSNIAGTTRDVIEVQMDLNGLSVTFLDMAGIRQSDDEVEAMGVARAIKRAGDADIRLFIISDNRELSDIGVSVQRDDIVVIGKSDTVGGKSRGISGKTGLGVDRVLTRISTVLADRAGKAGSFTRERHRIALEKAVIGLNSASDLLSDDSSMSEIIADELRLVVRSLDSLIGHVDVEQVLGEIFSSFCIGK